MNIKAVIFDMDGVITETSEMHYEAWRTLAEKLGIPFSKEENELLKGISRRDSLLKILELGHQVDRYDEIALDELMTEKNCHYLTRIGQYTKEQLNPGIYDFMLALKTHQIKIAVASASKSAPFLIDALGLRDLVDYIVDPTTVPGKPEPDIFLNAANYFNLKPHECIGVEDAKAGVEAIKKAGMFCIAIGDANILKEADLILDSTESLSLDTLKSL
ncbi:MAG: beta-phosphoglucomutase [Clostridia bacterium]|nr:beta-phosphoglucomutase [Clostridia bacterium]